MTVSAYIPAYNSANRLPRLVAALRVFADEIVVAVDERSKDGTAAAARACADQVNLFSHDLTFERIFEEQFRCAGDWIVRFDDDEMPSAAWTRNRIGGLIENPTITHYYFPRRWVVPPGDRFICVPPHWPDFALRMIRNRRQDIVRHGAVHSRLEVRGTPAYLHDLFIDHWNLVLYDRNAREHKVAEYELAAPRGSLSEYYLFEDFQYQTDAMHDAPRNRGAAGSPGSPAPYCVDVRILDLPPLLVAGGKYTADVEVVNRSVRTIVASTSLTADHPNRFCVHWVSADGRRRYFEGPRTTIPTPIAPGETRRALIRIDVPDEPGAYWLQGDLVEEFVAWYSLTPGAGFHEPRYVEVVAR